MTENISDVGTRQVGEIQNINRELTEKALHMRCLSYLANVKASLLTETIFEIDSSKKVLMNINEELKNQKKLIEKQNKLLTDKNQELKTFSHSVSHDLNAPLRSIYGFSKILLDEYQAKLDDTAVDYLTRIQNAAVRMELIIDAMLRLAKVSYHTLTLEKINLSELAHELVQQLQDQEKDRQVRVTIQANLQAKGDTELIRLALNNLLSNAWKYTRNVTPAIIEFGCKDIDNKQTFYVKDNGIGFDQENADKLFRDFSRIHQTNEYEGLGIGLAIARRVIIRHGGDIWATNNEDQGATFYFHMARNPKDIL